MIQDNINILPEIQKIFKNTIYTDWSQHESLYYTKGEVFLKKYLFCLFGCHCRSHFKTGAGKFMPVPVLKSVRL